MALRRAMRDTPIANMIVMTAGKPSGIAPMARATATLKVNSQSLPRRMSTKKVTTANARMTTTSKWLNSLILRVSGVSRTSVEESISEICPISVRSPVATTTPVPVPNVTRVEQ